MKSLKKIITGSLCLILSNIILYIIFRIDIDIRALYYMIGGLIAGVVMSNNG